MTRLILKPEHGTAIRHFRELLGGVVRYGTVRFDPEPETVKVGNSFVAHYDDGSTTTYRRVGEHHFQSM
jgi:hypothetical protein